MSNTTILMSSPRDCPEDETDITHRKHLIQHQWGSCFLGLGTSSFQPLLLAGMPLSPKAFPGPHVQFRCMNKSGTLLAAGGGRGRKDQVKLRSVLLYRGKYSQSLPNYAKLGNESVMGNMELGAQPWHGYQ